MGGKIDVVKGRLMEAVGTLIGNKKLRVQGQAEQALGMTRQTVQKEVTAAKQAAQNTADTVRNSL
jgi:uncharacterized protein YjbJ (UPF0337 family)